MFNPDFDLRRIEKVSIMPTNWKYYDKYCFQFQKGLNTTVINVTLLKNQCNLVLTYGSLACSINVMDYVKFPKASVISQRFQSLNNLSITVRNSFILPLKYSLNDDREVNCLVDLHEDVHRCILKHLNTTDFLNLVSTCRKFNRLQYDDLIWKSLGKRRQ